MLPPMEVPLSTAQRGALNHADGGPVTVIDRVLDRRYVLMPATMYERLVAALVDAGIDPAEIAES